MGMSSSTYAKKQRKLDDIANKITMFVYDTESISNSETIEDLSPVLADELGVDNIDYFLFMNRWDMGCRLLTSSFDKRFFNRRKVSIAFMEDVYAIIGFTPDEDANNVVQKPGNLEFGDAMMWLDDVAFSAKVSQPEMFLKLFGLSSSLKHLYLQVEKGCYLESGSNPMFKVGGYKSMTSKTKIYEFYLTVTTLSMLPLKEWFYKQ